MPKSTLFPLDAEPLEPARNRREPVVWLRRLVILSALDTSKSAVIRNIPFRRGLNIIKTRQMKTQGGPVAGHSVGKTLLMRMIRYSLGEPHFGTEETQQALARTKGLHSAFVVAHWTVSGVDWIVVRPLRSADSDESYSVAGDSWQQAVDAPEQKRPHRDFLDAVNAAVLADLPTFTLSRGRDAKWLDVLAWLSRDYQCGYRKANDWRHEDSHSGPSLDRDENSLIMQWLMGLLTADEIVSRLKHAELLNRRGKKKRAAERQQITLETLWESLRERMELPDDAEIAIEQASFSSVDPESVVEDKIKSLKRLKKERVAESGVAVLREAHGQAQQRAADGDATIRACEAVYEYQKKQIEEYEADPTKPYSRCQADPCWIKERAKETANDPARNDHLAEFHDNKQEAQRELKAARRAKKKLDQAASESRKKLESGEKGLVNVLAGIDRSIGKWNGLQKEAESFQSLINTAGRTIRSIKRADSEIDKSLKLLDDIRNKHRRKVKRLSGVYEQLLKEIFGPEAIGKVRVDGNGLQPMPDRKLAPAGAALSVMTTVLALDVSCLAASVYGLGDHPRLLMHDSPREGDMEGPLFRRLFEIVHELETQFIDSDNVSFQYIVTTTSDPPSHLARSKGAYVVETLDATSDAGRLMRKRF